MPEGQWSVIVGWLGGRSQPQISDGLLLLCPLGQWGTWVPLGKYWVLLLTKKLMWEFLVPLSSQGLLSASFPGTLTWEVPQKPWAILPECLARG